MSDYHSHHKSEWQCVDESLGTTRFSDPGSPGAPALLYPVEVECGQLCKIGYTHNTEPSCSVCTKLGSKGDVFVRWGSMTCPDTANKVYHGMAANAHHGNRGGGHNYICMMENPTYLTHDEGNNEGGHLYSVEYQSLTHVGGTTPENSEMACAVCESKVQGTTYTQWGRYECPDEYTEHVSGYMMSAHHGHYRTEHICVDRSFGSHPWGKTDNQDHSLLYPVEIDCYNPVLCGSKTGYQKDYEITCSICTKPLS